MEYGVFLVKVCVSWEAGHVFVCVPELMRSGVSLSARVYCGTVCIHKCSYMYSTCCSAGQMGAAWV